MTERLFVDTTVFAYSGGGPHELREACRALLALASTGDAQLHASVEVVQEYLFHRLRKVARPQALAEARDVAAMCLLHPFDTDVLELSLALVESSGVRGRDAVHAATALQHGFDTIVTADRDFDQVPGLTRVDPRTLA